MNIGDVLICKNRYLNSFGLVEQGEICVVIDISYTKTGETIYNVKFKQSNNYPFLNIKVIKNHFETIQEHRKRIIEDLL